MRILLLAQILPFPPESGPKIKTLGTVQALAKVHEVTVLAFIRSAAEESYARELAARGCTVHTIRLRRTRGHELLAAGYACITGQSFLLARDRRRMMHQAVRALLRDQQFDVIHVDQLNMAQYVPARFRGKVIFDAHNAAWVIAARMAEHERNPLKRFAFARESRRIRAAEQRICRRADLVLTTTQEDYDLLRAATRVPFPNAVIPIGVPITATPVHHACAPTLLHVGTMFYPPNADAVRWFASEVFPRIRHAVPDARFIVVGARPPADIMALHAPTAGIEVRGYVPDIGPLLQECAAAVVPTRAGSGMRVKILEAMAVGLPVVTTTVGAEGIAVTPGEHVLIGDDPASFAAACACILRDPALRSRLAINARTLAAAHYDWHVTGAATCAAYETLGQGHSNTGAPAERATTACPAASL